MKPKASQNALALQPHICTIQCASISFPRSFRCLGAARSFYYYYYYFFFCISFAVASSQLSEFIYKMFIWRSMSHTSCTMSYELNLIAQIWTRERKIEKEKQKSINVFFILLSVSQQSLKSALLSLYAYDERFSKQTNQFFFFLLLYITISIAFVCILSIDKTVLHLLHWIK